VDVVPAMVARARADTALPYAVAAAEALPFAAGTVDLVTVGSGVHWFDQRRFAAEAARVLRPGGALLLYEHAGATLPDPAYVDWMREAYLRRFPSPPRGALAAEFPAADGFAPERTDRWLDEVPMTRTQFAAYLATQSNVAGEPPERVRAWFDAELAPFFGGEGPELVRFRASYQLLRRGAAEPGRAAAVVAAAAACERPASG
jgi:SAM-dependent methyltransferase